MILFPVKLKKKKKKTLSLHCLFFNGFMYINGYTLYLFQGEGQSPYVHIPMA